MKTENRGGGGSGMTDVKEMIAGLEARKTRLELAIVALRGIEDGGEPVPVIAAAAPAKATRGKTGGRESGSPRRLSAVPSHPRSPAKAAKKNGKDWDLARKLWTQGIPTDEIGKRLGVSGAAVLYQSRTKKWPKRDKVFGPRKDKTANPEPAAPSLSSPAETAPPSRSKALGRAPRPIAVPRVATEEEPRKAPVPRRCDHCGLITEKDPCGKCGEKMVTWKSAMSA